MIAKRLVIVGVSVAAALGGTAVFLDQMAVAPDVGAAAPSGSVPSGLGRSRRITFPGGCPGRPARWRRNSPRTGSGGRRERVGSRSRGINGEPFTGFRSTGGTPPGGGSTHRTPGTITAGGTG